MWLKVRVRVKTVLLVLGLIEDRFLEIEELREELRWEHGR